MSVFSREYIHFILAFTSKEIKARYKKALFGFLWVILNPLLQMLVISFVFSLFIKIPNYALFLLSGLLGWGFFSLSLAKATPSIVYDSSLLKKAVFPIEAIPLSIVLSNFFHTLIAFLMLILFLVAQNSLSISQLLLLFVGLIWLLLLTISLSLITSTLQVRFRDISFFVQSVLLVWFYATPIMYSIELVPVELHNYFSINPLTSIFALIQMSVVRYSSLDTNIVLFNAVTTLVLMIIGIIIFNKNKKYFIDWL